MGAVASWVLRPVLTWKPSARLDIAAIYERGDSEGDGPATQNRHRFRGIHFANDETGFSGVDWRHLVVEANRRVGRRPDHQRVRLARGRHESLADIDATTEPVFHLHAFTDQRQASNELAIRAGCAPAARSPSVRTRSARTSSTANAGSSVGPGDPSSASPAGCS